MDDLNDLLDGLTEEELLALDAEFDPNVSHPETMLKEREKLL